MAMTGEAQGSRLSGWGEAPRVTIADLAAMLWAERTIVFGVGAAICALGLIASVLAPRPDLQAPIALLTVLLAGLVACAAGFSRGFTRRSRPSAARKRGAPMLAVIRTAAPLTHIQPIGKKPVLTVVEGGRC